MAPCIVWHTGTAAHRLLVCPHRTAPRVCVRVYACFPCLRSFPQLFDEQLKWWMDQLHTFLELPLDGPVGLLSAESDAGQATHCTALQAAAARLRGIMRPKGPPACMPLDDMRPVAARAGTPLLLPAAPAMACWINGLSARLAGL